MLSHIVLSSDELIEAIQSYLQEKRGPRILVTATEVNPESVTVTCEEEDIESDGFGSHY
jgi:hypothetical protein